MTWAATVIFADTSSFFGCNFCLWLTASYTLFKFNPPELRSSSASPGPSDRAGSLPSVARAKRTLHLQKGLLVSEVAA